MITANYIAYYRVSTARQGQSGLGLEAQQKAVQNYCNGSATIIEEYTEVETGKGSNALSKRPELAKAIAACKKQKATLVIAKLDRLARDVHFISGLMKSKVNFVCCDNPTATPLTLHILAAVAEDETRRISQRTKEALAAAKARGVELGKHGKNVLSKKNRLSADEFALSMQPIIDEIKALGLITGHAIADELTRRQIPTARGNTTWYQPNVFTLLKRIEQLS